MKKLMCLIALTLVFSTRASLIFAQTSPITIGGGGRAAAQAQTSQKLRDKSESFAAALTVQMIVTLIKAEVMW